MNLTLLCTVAIMAVIQASSALEFTRPTIIAHSVSEPREKLTKVYEDKTYSFHTRDFGKKGEQVPGFFVFEAARKLWIEITKLSTENARFGRSPLPQSKKQSVSWDYGGLVKNFYVELPLRTSASINLPDRMVLDEANAAYRLDFNSNLADEDALTSFWIRLEDLSDAFEEAEE